MDNRVPYAIFVTRKNILVRANKIFPGEIYLLVRTVAELSIGLVVSLSKFCSVKCRHLFTFVLYYSGCKGFGSCCAETADVADTGQIFLFFYVLLTLHLSIILVINQPNA